MEKSATIDRIADVIGIPANAVRKIQMIQSRCLVNPDLVRTAAIHILEISPDVEKFIAHNATIARITKNARKAYKDKQREQKMITTIQPKIAKIAKK